MSEAKILLKQNQTAFEIDDIVALILFKEINYIKGRN